MRFFSQQKVRRKYKKSLFSALKSRAWCFLRTYVSEKEIQKHQKIASIHAGAKRVIQTCNRLIPLITRGTLLALVFAITSTAESNSASIRKLDTLNVIPSHVESSTWQNVNATLIHDVKENGVYQNFNTDNAAYLVVPQVKEQTPVISVPPVIQNTESGATDHTSSEVQGEVSGDQVTPSQTVTPSEPADSSNNASAEETQATHESVAPTTPAPEQPSSQTSLRFEEGNIFTGFTSLSTKKLPLALETITEPNPSSDSVSTTTVNETTSNPSSSEVGTTTEIHNASSTLEHDSGRAQGSMITFTDFALPQLNSGQFILTTKLRMSLGGLTHIPQGTLAPTLEVEYSFGDQWLSGGTILLDGEVSNALNGGYFFFEIPGITKVSDLEKFKVRVSYQGEQSTLEQVYIDSVWLDIDTETFDKDLLRERILPKMLPYLDLPKMSTLISDEIDFTRTEVPHFVLRYESQRNFAIRFLRSLFAKNLAEVEEVTFTHNDVGKVHVTPKIDVTTDGLISLQLSEEDKQVLQPGTYTVELTINEGGKTFVDSFEFQWGMLAINPNQTEYKVGDTAHISLGALSPNGNTLCDANLALYIIDPKEYISKVPVAASGLCNGNNVIDRADYLADVVTDTPGMYEMYVENLDEHGDVLSHTSDTFVVVDAHSLSISRNGPTRIYPPSLYPMQLTVSAVDGFSGVVTERVPLDFIVSETDASIARTDTEQVLTWHVSLGKGESKTVSYSFDAPDVSPYLYTVGPADMTDDTESVVVHEEVPSKELQVSAQIIALNEGTQEVETVTKEPEVSTTTKEVFQNTSDNTTTATTSDTADMHASSTPEAETTGTSVGTAQTTENSTNGIRIPRSTKTKYTEHRKWQIASDATGSMIVFWTDGASIPAGWTCISCTSTSTFYQRFPLGGATYGTTGGVATTTHTADGTVNASTLANSENNAGAAVSIVSHSHTITPTIGSTTTLPAYRQLRVIQNNSAGIPSTIPAGAILIFDGTLPAGWSRYTALDNRYPYGENTIVSGGSNTHIHSVMGTTTAASGSTYNSRTGGTQVTAAGNTHTHTLNSSTTPVNHEPPYIEVVFATSSSATSTPVNAIAMWSDTPPAGWLNRSSSAGDPFYNRYIKGAATYGTTGGADTHTHANMSASSSAVIGTTNARTGASGASNLHTHVVDVANFSTASNTPPYVSVIFAKYYGLIPIYNQFAYRWYANTNATTPTDPWPAGVDDVTENQPIDSSLTPVKSGDVVRLRMQLNVSNSTTTGESFKLQYGTTTSVCTVVSSWTDVGALASSTAWVGYDNATPADGATLSSSTISGTEKLESYEETNPTVTLPNAIGIGEDGEWDYVLKQNTAEAGTNYCFRMVESNGTPLFSYTQYPMLVTNEKPQATSLSKPFDNEKLASTTPWFEFSSTDTEANDMSYQIQIDNDYNFSSTVFDQNTVSNGDQFQNLVTPADKDPYTNGERIRYTPPSALTNGVTYYWRVRAQDPTGSNTWGTWSTIYSFTVDTTVTVSTWFQTTQDQFSSDTLEGTDAMITNLVQLSSGSTTGTTTSSQLDFLHGSVGNAWGSLSWNDNETVGDIKYRLQYYDDTTNSWLFIPDADLANNSTGFDTSPVSLLTLSVDTYRIIRVLGVFTNIGGSPTLSDWTISWGYRIDTPTNSAPFPSEKVSTTTPVFKFTTTDPQGDDLEYEIQWSTTYAFTASTTRNSSTSAGFTNLTNGGDTNPFYSGNSIQFKIQAADALTNGTTYWWRVRARDPFGSNQYSFYTDPQSFTVDTTVTVSTWFQTTSSQFDHDTLSGTISTGADTVTVATTSVESLIAYAEGVITTPRYRVWNGTTWSAENSALDVNAPITWTVTRAAPSINEYVLATMGTDADVNVQVYRNGSWGHLQEVTTSIADTNMRGFDVAYEQLSGDAMVVTCDGDANPSYYIWNGSTWTNGGAVGLTSGNTCGWVKLISDPTSDEIIAITRDTSGTAYEARVWNGSSWGNSATWGSMQNTQLNHEGIAAAYEDSGNQAVVAVSSGTAARFSWRAWDGAAWTAAANITLGNDFESGTIASDKGTDNMALCYVDEDQDIGTVFWNGSAWGAFTERYTTWATPGVIYDDRPVDCAYEVGGARDGYLMQAYATTTGLAYQSWNGATWSTAAKVSTIGAGPRVQARRTGDNLIQVMEYASTTDRYDYAYWNGTSWSTAQTLETDASSGASPFKEPLMIAPKNPVTTGTVVGSPAINFYDGSGPYWQQMSWNDTKTGGSSILYQVEYYDTASSSWKLVPDSMIPNNSVGTSTGPINLTNILPVSTYSQLRPVANMTCNLGTCPTLSDWTITWSAGITISGTAQQYDQSTNVTSGTVAVAVNGVLQTGKTGTISGGTWSIANVNTSPGDVVTVFIDGANDQNEAVAVARYDGIGNMDGLKLFERHLTLGSNDATTTPFTNANIGLYDYTQDEDLFFNATGTLLNMCVDVSCGDSELYIMSTSTYQQSGTTYVNYIENNGTLSPEGNTMYVARSWDNNATTTSATSNIIFTATSTTETIDETGAHSPSFYNLSFGTTTGNATWNVITALDINNDLTVTRGTFNRGSLSMTIGGALSNGANGFWSGIGTTTFDGSGTKNWSDSNATLQNVGRVVVDGTIKTVQLAGNVHAQNITIGADDTLDVTNGNYGISLYGDFINNNTFLSRAGDVSFIATTTNHVVTAGSDPFYNLTFNGVGGAWSFTEANLTVSNNLTIATGTVTMPTGTTTLSGSFSSVGGTFAHNNATVLFDAGSAKTIAASGTPFTNAFYNMVFSGTGSWTFLDTNATTSKNLIITQGAVTLPSANLSVGGSFAQSGGSFAHNSGTVQFTNASTETIDVNGSSFNSISCTGSGSRSFVDASVTALGSVWVTGGTLVLPSGTFSIGGSFGNFATITHNNGTVLFNSTDGGETINFGNSSLYNVTFANTTGGWTITNPATTTNNFTLTSASSFTLSSGQTLAVGGVFTNSIGGASTTWTGSILSLEAGNYSINTKTNTGDAYSTLRIKANTDIQMWNSTSTAYVVDSTGSLYSQDHNGVDGDLYIFGEYVRSSGTEHWSYGTDFDGTALTASTSRKVNVRIASSTTALFTGSTLSILGTTTATTTIANQGNGAYVLNVLNGTTTTSFYDFANLGTTGLSLSGTTKVTGLSDGRFVPGIAGGTGLTISSTTIDTNPGLQIYHVDFSTTTVISATNVTQNNGTPTSFWWFRQSLGNIDGEAFDNDTGDPGSIRWDDSSLVITISGTVYSDDGVTPMSSPTCDGSTQNIRVRIQGGSTYTGSCNAGTGAYTIGGVVIVGDPVVTVYLDTNGGAQGTVITKTPTANLTNFNIYQNRVITRHEDVVPLTIADMAVYDATYDSDIRYDAATGTTNTLTVFNNTELHIASSTTFAPGGNITINGNASSSSQDGTLHIDDYATFTGAATSTYTIGGSFIMDTGATFTAASTSVILNATTTGKTVTAYQGQEIGFNTLSFTGVGGGWNINTAIRSAGNIAVATGTVTGTGNITVTNGSLSGNGLLSMGSGTTTIEQSNTLGGTTPWTFGNLVLGNGSVVGTTTMGGATTTILGKLTISTAHFLNAAGTVWNLAGTGNVFVENGTFIEASSTVRYSGAGATNVLSTGYYNLDLMAQGGAPTYTATGLGIVVGHTMTVGGATTTTFTLDTNDPALDVNGDVTIMSTGILSGSNSASTTIGGNWSNSGSFVGNGGTVTFDGTGTTNISAGGSSFSNLVLNNSATCTVIGGATTTGAFTITNVGSVTVASSTTLAVGGVFTNSVGGGATTWTGSTVYLYGGINYQMNPKTVTDVYHTLLVGANTDVRMWNSSANTYTVDASGSLYSQDHGNTDGALYIYGNYVGNGGTDFWNYGTDFDGTTLGGSSRKVTVSFANGASADITSGGLSVTGVGSASTTIQNQGAGTYGLHVGGSASTTWSYYELRNMNSAGLTFSGTPNVVTLSYGDIVVSQNSGTGITVGGSVITQNPAKTFTGNIFNTGGGASPAYNVTATGTSVSSWRFTNHTGSIAGEAYDVDPNGDPGYVVWDNSAALITVSGNVYTNEGSGVSSVCDGSTNNITLRVAGLTSYSTSCNASTGAYSIGGVAYGPNDSLVVYIDNMSAKAATVSADPVSNIGNMDIYENRVIVRHENTDPLTIADMAVWDSSDDADIPFTAVDAGSDTLTLPANRKLIVWTGKTFTPNGNVTVSGGGAGASYDGTLEVYANATFNATGSETHTIGGSLISDANATINAAQSTIAMTTTGATRTFDVNNASLYNLTFNGSGSWSVADATLSVGNDFTITQGAVTLPSGTTTVSGSLAVTGGSFVSSGGTMLFNASAAKTIRANGSSFGALTINGSGSFTMLDTNATTTKDVHIITGTLTSATGTLTVGGNFINNATFTHGNGTLRFTSASSTIVTANGSDLASTTFAGGGSYTFTDTNEALAGSLTIQNGSVTLATGTMSIAGSFLNTGGSFNHASGTILFNSSDVGETINPGSSAFYTVSFGSAGGGWTISGNATTTSNFSLTNASNFTLASSTRLFVGGVFTNLVGGAATTWTGSTLVINSGTGYTVNSKTAGGDIYNNFIVGSSTALRLWDSTGTITLTDSASSIYSQDHAGVSGALNIYGNYTRSTGSDYWSYATDFDGTALGGSARQAMVYIASGATTTITGGALNVVGANGFDTTVANQGSGTYAIGVYGGTFNAQYYSFSNMDARGLVLSGDTTTVTSLTEGNFTLAVNGGSLITVSSSTLNYNTGLISTNNSFATTSAITGTNVTINGTTPSAWTFTGHTGNLAGEAFDSDGADACGSIRWDNSSCLLTQQSGYRFRNDDGGEGVPNSEWYDSNWTKRRRVNVTNYDAVSYANAAVKITVPYDADMQADFDDLRFTSSNGTTLLSHFTEKYTASTNAVVWVEVPTLATSTITEIYMYYGNGGATDGSATSTFNFVDTFEDGNITEYGGDTSLFNVGASFAYERTKGLDTTGNQNAKATDGIYQTGSLVRQGETIRYMQYIDTSTGSGDEPCTLFGVQTPGSNNQNYGVCLELFGTDRVSLARDVDYNDASGVMLASTTITYVTGWYEVEVDWKTNNQIIVRVSKDGSLVASTTATDSTYTSGGMGFTFWFQHGGWDLYTSRPYIATTPSTTIGYEQVSGGASWLAARNTLATSIAAGSKARVRFLVENTGLPVTNQNYQLEFAPKGASPSCEAVALSAYNPVPVVASCGSSAVCMESSTHFSSLSGTTDVLGGTGTFTQGQIVEDPNNKTGNISVQSNEYTELEYEFTPTVNASDSRYCLRVSNTGVDLDSYTHVAEFGMVFAPNITAASLNGGADIVLTGGATTTMYATGTVTDLNGYTDLAGATTTIYRSGVGDTCSADTNNCYISGNSKCSFVNCAGNSCDITCRADIYYHADPTDVGTYAAETWRALLSVIDHSGLVATGTAPSIDLLTLRAITVDSSINYGSLAVSSDTGSYNASTTVQNIGNDSLDISIEGTDLTDGASSVIPVNNEKYATSTFTYSSCVYCNALSGTPVNYRVDLNKPADTNPVTDQIFWGIAIPFGVAGKAHSGTNIFYAIGNLP